ncbi:uncharacterized protein A1O9_01724 [Exophiala aquamarina CBS 119918]|uniref:GPI anchored protein n=1 Tax=Exophiala aquamarina CBS 119918 TaxID=1182545 RepID=A0A072PV80_9EURO|nr:uncharacterized protein A1O9_01724 [Exophiala aquamarina CBS 119918]KEF63746.1 hypothetical protein A1O9_01724 [Exophiala aquamarina CBS 119918]
MRFLYAVATALLAAVATAQQNNAISIPEGSSTLQVTAGQPLVIDWTNPSDGTVTIKLVQDPITPDSGIILASGIPASVGSATLQIPDAADVNSFQYTIEIIDDTDPSNINFSPNFGIIGATGTATGSASTASVTGSTVSGSSTASTTGSATDSTDTSSATTTDESSSSTQSATTTSGSSSTRTTSTSASAASQTTSAPSSGAGVMRVQGGLVAMAIGVVAAVM